MWKFDVDEEVQINEITEYNDVAEGEIVVQASSCSRADCVSRCPPQLVHLPPQLSLLRQCTSYPFRPLAQPWPERSSYSFYTRSFLRVSFPNVIARVNMMRTEFCFPDTPTPTPPGHIVDHHPDPRLRPALVLNLQGTPGKGQTILELGADTLSLRETM